MKTHFRPLLGGTLVLLCAIPLTARAAATRAAQPEKREQATLNALAWTEWELAAPAYPGLEKRPFLKFSDTRLMASVGCNSLGGAYSLDGTYSLDGAKITVKPLMSTRMACPEPVMKAENHYSQALQGARTFAVSADGRSLSLRGSQTLTFRFTGRTAQGWVQTETKVLNVAPQLGPQLDGDKTPKYLQLEDLSEGVSWGHFREAHIEGFDFVPGYRYQISVAVERDARSGDKRLRLLQIVIQQWTEAVTLAANEKIFEVAPTKVEAIGVAPVQCLQVREAGGHWMNFYAPIEGFDFEEGWRYRLQVAVRPVKNPPADAPNLRYTLVRLLDKSPVIF